MSPKQQEVEYLEHCAEEAHADPEVVHHWYGPVTVMVAETIGMLSGTTPVVRHDDVLGYVASGLTPLGRPVSAVGDTALDALQTLLLVVDGEGLENPGAGLRPGGAR